MDEATAKDRLLLATLANVVSQTIRQEDVR